MPFPLRPRLVVLSLALAVLAGGLGACQPPRQAPKDQAALDAAALEAQGYAHPPMVSTVSAADPGFIVVAGTTLPDSRVRFTFNDSLKGGAQAVGVTADDQGRFRAEVPTTRNGGLYDVTVDDGGQPRPGDGRLFVPPGHPELATLLRPGLPSRLLAAPAPGVAVVDYDGAGAFAVSGRVAPNADVSVMVQDEIRALERSDAQGAFSAKTQIIPAPGPVPQTINVIVQVGNQTFRRAVDIVAAPAGPGDQLTVTPNGYRADWVVPGGGVQSTIVF